MSWAGRTHGFALQRLMAGFQSRAIDVLFQFSAPLTSSSRTLKLERVQKRAPSGQAVS